MYSWWWVGLSPETCRVKHLRRINRNCCISLELFHYQMRRFVVVTTAVIWSGSWFDDNHLYPCGPGSSVGISTELRAGRSWDRIPVGARFSAPVQTVPVAHPTSCTMGTGSLPGVKSGRGVTLTPHLLLVPWSRKGRAITWLPLWAVRPVQSLSACTGVHFTFYLYPSSFLSDLFRSQMLDFRLRILSSWFCSILNHHL